MKDKERKVKVYFSIFSNTSQVIIFRWSYRGISVLFLLIIFSILHPIIVCECTLAKFLLEHFQEVFLRK